MEAAFFLGLGFDQAYGLQSAADIDASVGSLEGYLDRWFWFLRCRCVRKNRVQYFFGGQVVGTSLLKVNAKSCNRA